MAWGLLILAGLFEIAWAIGLKYSEGLTRFWPSVGTGLAMLISVWLLGIAMKSLPLGTAYMVWTGIGAVGSFVVGVVFLAEPVTAMRMAAAGMIVAGIVTMKLAS